MDGKEKVSYKLLCNACLCVGQGLNLITDVKLKGFYLDALNEISVSFICLYFFPDNRITINQIIQRHALQKQIQQQINRHKLPSILPLTNLRYT